MQLKKLGLVIVQFVHYIKIIICSRNSDKVLDALYSLSSSKYGIGYSAHCISCKTQDYHFFDIQHSKRSHFDEQKRSMRPFLTLLF